MERVNGLYTALVTPFDISGNLDEEGLRENIRFQIENNVDGIVPLGTTGESPTMTAEEKKAIIKIAVKEAKGKVPVMVGTGSNSTQQTIENTRMAKDLGADSALIVSPYYNKPTQEGIYRHYKAVVEEVGLPVMVYNIQGRTGQNISTELLCRLADLPLIIGVKEASGNVSQMSDVIEKIALQREDFSVMSGDDSLTLPLLALGGHGVISVISNLIPFQVKEMIMLMRQENVLMARAIHYRLMNFIRVAFIETNPIPIKAAMQLCGMSAGGCRLPLCELQPENLEKIKWAVNALQIIPTNV